MEEAECVAESSEMIAKLYSFEKKPPYYFLNKSGFNSMRNLWFQIHLRAPSPPNDRRTSEHEVMADIYAYLQIASQVRLFPLPEVWWV